MKILKPTIIVAGRGILEHRQWQVWATGAVIYLGLIAIPLRRLFTVTSWLILLLAAGMASQGAAFLMQADLLPSFGNNLWDTSFILSDNSMLGVLLHVLSRQPGEGIATIPVDPSPSALPG